MKRARRSSQNIQRTTHYCRARHSAACSTPEALLQEMALHVNACVQEMATASGRSQGATSAMAAIMGLNFRCHCIAWDVGCNGWDGGYSLLFQFLEDVIAGFKACNCQIFRPLSNALEWNGELSPTSECFVWIMMLSYGTRAESFHTRTSSLARVGLILFLTMDATSVATWKVNPDNESAHWSFDCTKIEYLEMTV